MCILLETKRREEEIGSDIEIPGYTLRELRRSDTAGDRGGGGLAVYTRQLDGLVFQEYSPDIEDQDCHFVRNERMWITTKSLSTKSAVCGAYYGCQYPDNRNSVWNETIYRVVHAEAAILRSQGYRIIMLADFNGHIGCEPGIGIQGNSPNINYNGRLLLDFIHRGGLKHVNGEQHLVKGLWTRQRGASRTVLDLALISEEHLGSIMSLMIDDQGIYGGSSDHNWLFLELEDCFVQKKRILNVPTKKSGFQIEQNQDWTFFQSEIRSMLRGQNLQSMDEDQLATLISGSLLESGTKTIGLKSSTACLKKKPQRLPPSLVEELKLKRQLEKDRKTASTNSLPNVKDLEDKFLDQKQRANEALFVHNNRDREKIMKDCSGSSTKAKQNFWKHISSKMKQSSDITGVVDPVSGTLKCGREEIAMEVEKHFCRVFDGGLEPFPADVVQENQPVYSESHLDEHSYCVEPNPKLPKLNSSGRLEEDPAGWMDKEYLLSEVKKAVKLMKGGRAKGWDNIPNEFLMNSPDEMLWAITVLFNKIKKSGVTPLGWNRGRVTIIFKKGLRELLGNYRPITVIISLCGLDSRVLNCRLTEVVETHKLIGEDQNGFRRGRRMTDNNFVLDSVLWKSKYRRKSVHLCYIDIAKAYDSVNRRILWSKLSSMGIGGQFLQSLKALYTGDSVVSSVNGISTRPVYLQRGLRQGCSLSPLLFALYISEIGKELALSPLGFQLGGQVVSGLCFADDIVIMAEDPDGLCKLIKMVKLICDNLEMVISVSKSNVVSPEDQELWQILGPEDDVVLSLKSVLIYKYLGTETTLKMSTTGSKRQERCMTTAKRYKFGCFYLAKSGPDVVDMALATWSNIAIPSMLTGCEVIPFTESTIEAIERVQAQLSKSVLGLPQSAPNVCAQTELGLKPFRLLLWRQQLGFYQRVLRLPKSRWVSMAMSDHLSGEWPSPYIAYITRIMEGIKMFDLLPTEHGVNIHMNEWALQETNRKISLLQLPCITSVKSFERQPYVFESGALSTIAQFRLSCAGLGNKAPNVGGFRWGQCILCSASLDEMHIAFCCPALAVHRNNHTSITSFWNQCRLGMHGLEESYRRFVNGLTIHGVSISKKEYKDRGLELLTMKEAWLRMTGYSCVLNSLIYLLEIL